MPSERGSLRIPAVVVLISAIVVLAGPNRLPDAGADILKFGAVVEVEPGDGTRNLLVGTDIPGGYVINTAPGLTSETFDSVTIGGVPDSSGILTVSGSGAILTSQSQSLSQFNVGFRGAGRLNILNGGQVVTLGGPSPFSSNSVGTAEGSTGSVLVDGAGSLFKVTGHFVIGYGNRDAPGIPGAPTSGTVMVSNGGEVTVLGSGPEAVMIGSDAGASGTLAIAGAGSTFTTAQLLWLGFRGTGTLLVSEGGSLTTGGVAYVGGTGIGGTGTGQATVTGTGSGWIVGQLLTVGLSGSGSLSLAGGGNVSAPEVRVGFGPGGTGTLVVSEGGSLTTSGPASIGDQVGATGQATLTGASSLWTIGGPLTVGRHGRGSLSASEGGKVSAPEVRVGGGPGGTGTVAVSTSDPAGWGLDVAGRMFVGLGGSGPTSGLLDVREQGRVKVRRIDIGVGAQGSGTVVLRGSSGLLLLSGEDPSNPGSAGSVRVGNAGGAGSLVVADGAQIQMDTTALPGPGDPALVSGSQLRVGTGAANSVGTATISGTNSKVIVNTVVVSGGVQVARDGATGTLTVRDGAAITVDGPTPQLRVGREAGSVGTLNILNGGQVVVTSTDGQGNGIIGRDPAVTDGQGNPVSPPAIGRVTVSGAGSLLQVPNILLVGLPNSNLWPQPGGNLSPEPGGSAVLTMARGGTVTAPIVRIGSKDILNGSGVINGTVECFDCIVEPGLSPGTLTVTGNYVAGPGSRLVLEVSGASSDALQVGGTVELQPGAKIDVVVDPSVDPVVGTYTLLQSGGVPLLDVVVTSEGGATIQPAPAFTQLVGVETTLSAGGQVTVSLNVDIDIKPGSADNPVNLGSDVIPVAILSSPTFDARTVQPESVNLAGASVKMVGKSDKYLCHAEDANGDTLEDLVCQVNTSQLQAGVGLAVLNAVTSSGQLITGSDTVRVVP